MPTLTIDGRSVTVPEGSTILDAARAMAIDVPTLCWYPKLPVVGNCRICLVQVEGTPKLVASCATAAADGMRVTPNRTTPSRIDRRARCSSSAIPRKTSRTSALATSSSRSCIATRCPPHDARRLPLRTVTSAMATRSSSTTCRRAFSARDVCARARTSRSSACSTSRYRGDHAQIIVGADGNPEHAGCTWCGECVRVCPTGAIHDILSLARPSDSGTAMAAYGDARTPWQRPRATRHRGTALRYDQSRTGMDTACATSRRGSLSRSNRAQRVSLLRRRMSDRSAGKGRSSHPREEPVDRRGHAEPGIDLREGSLRL